MMNAFGKVPFVFVRSRELQSFLPGIFMGSLLEIPPHWHMAIYWKSNMTKYSIIITHRATSGLEAGSHRLIHKYIDGVQKET